MPSHNVFGVQFMDDNATIRYNVYDLQTKDYCACNVPFFCNAQVLNNPFPDIVPRVMKRRREDKDKKSKSKMKAEK